MFLRETVIKGKRYLTIVESYREDGKVRQRLIGSLGCLDKLEGKDKLKKIAVSLLKYCKTNRTHFDITTMCEKERKNWGAPVIVRNLWDRFELDKLFTEITKGYKIKFDFFSSVFLMVLDRLYEPKSKLRSYEEASKYDGIKEPELQHLYRALDILADKKEVIEEYLFNANQSLFNTKIDIVFYDVTTLYFESVRKDELKCFGFSKDLKVNEVQIILGLLIDMEGRPIGFDIFAGNTFEGHTVKAILDKLNKRFKINRLIFVGDCGILSRENIEIINKLGYEYIVGSRIKNKTKKIQDEILSCDGYIEVKSGDEIFRYKEIAIGEGKLICAYSSEREKRDREERKRLIEKAEKLVEKVGSIITRRGALRYIKIESVGINKIDEGKIREDERWDGYYGVETNCKFMIPEDILKIYHQLWKIEEAFRILKSHFEARPIYHWTPRRIKGHLVLCFIAFLLERTLEMELKKSGIEYSVGKIREAIKSLEFSEVEIEGERFRIRSKVEGLSNDILRVLKIRIPPNITRVGEL
jgi:transposase